jgi:FAD dependent oxidoreductase TIGR03364
MPSADIAIVGGGILGLTHALRAAASGRRVVLFERGIRAQGASTRNFGMVWPIGQPPGERYERAMRSRQLWLEFLEAADLPYQATGSLHVCRTPEEAAVCQEFAEEAPHLGVECAWLDAAATLERSGSVRAEGLLGALWSPTEFTVDPRQVIAAMPAYLESRYGVILRFGQAVRRVDLPRVETGNEVWDAGEAVICSGDDFGTLFPEAYAGSGLIRCKLQMLRTVPQPEGWTLGPSLAAGLTLQHYGSFGICGTLPALKARLAAEYPDHLRWGIHVMASQTAENEVTLGDSHEYGDSPEVFNREEVDDLILNYLGRFARFPDRRIGQRWYGTYAKHPEQPWFEAEPAPGVRVVTGTGGAGMTLSFGLAEQHEKEWWR